MDHRDKVFCWERESWEALDFPQSARLTHKMTKNKRDMTDKYLSIHPLVSPRQVPCKTKQVLGGNYQHSSAEGVESSRSC